MQDIRSIHRARKLIEELPKHNNVVYRAAVAAGYSEKTALKQGKRLLNHALKVQAADIAEQPLLKKQEALSVLEKVGISPEQLRERIRMLAMQDGELGVALKVLTALAKHDNIDLTSEQKSATVVPVLNVTVREGDNNGPVEPVYATVSRNTSFATREDEEKKD
jgi:hypothetical protein